jgi:hypothetical protein
MTHLKVINASRGSIHSYENLKGKLYKCNANIYFNQQCLKKQLIPTYGKIKVPNTSPAQKYTTENSQLKNQRRNQIFTHQKTKTEPRNLPPTHIPSQYLEQNLAIHPTHN